jgi:methyl-accepting chemotaxis protein
MMSTAPPADEETQLQAESLARRVSYAVQVARYVRIAALAMALPAAGLWLAFRQYAQLSGIALVALFAGVVATVAGVLLRRGRAYAGFYVLLGGFLGAIVPAYIMLAEVRPAALLGYALIVMLSMFLLGRARSRLMNGLTLGSLVLGVALAAWGWVPEFAPLSVTISTLTTVIVTGAASIALALAFGTIAAGQEEFFLAAGRAGRELGRRAAAEAAERAQMQATVEQYATYTAEVGRGRLDDRLALAVDESSPLARLGHNLNEMVAGLQEMTRQVRDTAAELTGAAAEILATTVQQSSGAGEQSAAITQAGTSIGEVRAIAEQTAGRSQGVADLAQRTAEVAQAGEQAVVEAIAGMGEVQQKVDTIAQYILTLSERAQSIGQIVATVSEIASESNMLALNAAVEAARAGEAGRGFAVVASEVRALAEQSRKATVQVKELLTEIQSGVNAAVMATEEGIKRASVGSKLASEAGRAIRELTDGVGESAEAALQIVASAAQQEAGMQQVAQAMGQIQAVAGQTAVSARQTENAAGDLNRLAGRLEELVARYRL